MIVSGALGILFNPDMIYCEGTPDGKYKVIAENEAYTVTLYENLSKTSVGNIMRKIAFQIEFQVSKDED